jgi:spore photoproduct lyase
MSIQEWIWQDKLKTVEKVTRKSMKIRESGRSSDYISPSFGHGCLFNCSYCYMKRHKPSGLTIAKNHGEILTAINKHVYFYADVAKPNQTHKEYITYDISCNEDFALHAKYHNWQKIFEFFRDHDKAMGTFATKTIPNAFLKFNPKGKIRIRFSLMPQNLADLLEPNTAPIINRIEAIDKFIEAGYDVHVNFSPVVKYTGWLADYRQLFELLDIHVKNKTKVLSEVIFLTHNENKHLQNLQDNLPGENFLWTPENQEAKKSQYGGDNIRYKYKEKATMIAKWRNLHDQLIPWNKIRYIF